MIKDLILKKCFTDFQDAWQLRSTNEVMESMIFERFINYVILSQDELGTFVGRPELLEFCCTGGGADAKLDGVGIKMNGQLVSSIDDINQIIENSKKIEVEFFVIQSKEATDFDSAAFSTFGVGVKNFFSDPLLPENEKIKLIRELKNYIFEQESVYRKLVKNPSVNIYYVFCGTTPDDEHTKAIKQLFIKGVKECQDCLGDISLEIVDGKRIIEKCKDLENDFSIELNICDIFPLTVYDNELVKKAYAFTCESTELLKLLTKDDGIRRSLFDNNVRDYLGNRSGVNSEIEHTISSEPEMFLMCNNGITIVCSDFIQIKDKLVSIDNPQIVNGCQTCSTIFLQRSNPSLKKVQVLVKLICTEDSSITNKIVRGTNKQNQVLEESFETTKPFHQMLEDYFEAKCTSIRLYYERRNKQYSSIPTINRWQIVNLRVMTQSFVAVFLQKPHESHRHEAVLLQKYAGVNGKIYNSAHSPYPYYISALIWYKFEDVFRRNILSDKKELRPYIAHLYYIFSFTAGHYPLNAESKKDALEKYCKKLEELLFSEHFDEIVCDVERTFNRCKSEWIQSGKSKYSIKDNKEFTEQLNRTAREVFVNKKINLEEDTNVLEKERWLYGNILFVKYVKKHWFAFIKTDDCTENVYFDSKSYTGQERYLVPGTAVRFVMTSKFEKDEKLYFATKVEVVKK